MSALEEEEVGGGKGSLKQKVLQSIKFPEVSAYFPLVKT